MLEGYDYIIPNYTPQEPEPVLSNSRESARRLSAYLIQGIQNIYDGHINPNDEGYKVYKTWINDESSNMTSLLDEERAVKEILKSFDKHFETYKDSPFFLIFTIDRTVNYKPYNISSSTTVLDIMKLHYDMMNGKELKPLAVLENEPRLNKSLKNSIKYIMAAAKQAMKSAELTK